MALKSKRSEWMLFSLLNMTMTLAQSTLNTFVSVICFRYRTLMKSRLYDKCIFEGWVLYRDSAGGPRGLP